MFTVLDTNLLGLYHQQPHLHSIRVTNLLIHQTSDTVTPLVFASKILQILREKEAGQYSVTMCIKLMSSISLPK